ncbi:DUF5710 domain-containing protein [Planomonospora parontospora]|uniref:DUF5710 domain-containing protein n=1 Tax=Planomonospora parontospora TaxID=58119 RepID=UPI0019BC953C|nr:DUF5710 domain-containing protein [Planomonospora parontospora]GGL48385.1 hypothetical protein GCM10014719_57080 [Planomonospora parontospora subsp. antibiotica]GII18749.1 hypothetical protein Ppa05_54750 [Planomonospora parontospora subsp. antibiotica]
MAVNRLWLDVPYGQKDEAKALGARWDPAAKRWYAPRPGMDGLHRWAPLPDVPDLLPGEDRTFGSGLFVDLVPSSCWFTNVRSCVDERDWERLRRMITRRAGHRCEACGRGEDRATGRWLEAHERWAYDPATRTQTLKRLLCLCTDCHMATHMGLADIQGKGAQARAHLQAVTGMSSIRARAHIDAAFTQWRTRSAATWRLDLSILTDAGVTLAPPPEAAARTHQAQQRLQGVRTGAIPTVPRSIAPAPRISPRSERPASTPSIERPGPFDPPIPSADHSRR